LTVLTITSIVVFARMRAVERPVTLVRTAATPTAVVAVTTSWEAFPSLWGKLLDEVWAFLRRSGLATGRNVMLYKDDRPDVEVGVEVAGAFAGEGRVVASSLPAGLAAMTVARGAPSREGLAAGHAAVLAWCNANDHEVVGACWEVYGHWLDDQDPAAYETEIYWLVREG
jgi:effector-binding domain-containing protein